MFKKYKPTIIILSVIALIAAGIVNYVKDLMDEPFDIEIPKEFIYNGQKIALAWTDDNTGENLIIQSDKKEYSGFNTVDVYFSITNISNKNQEMDVVIWLEEGKRSVEKIEKLDGDNQSSLNILQYSSVIPSLPAPLRGARPGDSRLRGNDKGEGGNDREQAAQAGARKDIKGFTNGYAVNDEIESGQTNYYKATIKYPTLSKGEFFIEAFGRKEGSKQSPLTPLAKGGNGDQIPPLLRGARGDQIGYGHLDPWYSSSWSYKRAITLQGSKIATTTTAFPILATTTLADLKTTTNGGKVENDNGYDIIFVDSDDSALLNYEREKYASTTGEIAYWIKTDIASSTDKTIYMYYGNAGASDTATTTGVWDNNFVGVWHLPDQTTASGTDSTLYNNDGNVMKGASTTALSQIDGGMQFDGVDDKIIVASSTSLDVLATALTASAWIMNKDASHSWDRIVSKKESWNNTNGFEVSLVDPGTGLGRISILGSGNTSLNLPCVTDWRNTDLNKWVNVTVVYNSTTASLYCNDVFKGSGAIQAVIGNDVYFGIGIHIGDYKQGTYPGNFFQGLIDEVRVSNTARTAGWIRTEWNNQSSVGSFMTIGAEISSWPAVTTNAAAKIASTIATANGNITNIGTATVTERGFKYGLTEADTWTVSETGGFSAGVFKLDIANLTPGATYYIRAFATSADGTGYGSYVSFITLSSQTGSPIIFKKNTILKENVILK